jgi:hypothetical protein
VTYEDMSDIRVVDNDSPHIVSMVPENERITFTFVHHSKMASAINASKKSGPIGRWILKKLRYF